MFYSIYSTWLYPPIVNNYSHIHVPLGGIVKLIMTAQWRTTKKQLTNNTKHVPQNNPLGPGSPEVCEKTFSTYFIPQPVEITLTYSQIFIKDNQVIRAVTKSRGPGIFPCYYACEPIGLIGNKRKTKPKVLPCCTIPRSVYVSGKLPTYPSPKPTLTLTSHLGQNVGLGEG